MQVVTFGSASVGNAGNPWYGKSMTDTGNHGNASVCNAGELWYCQTVTDACNTTVMQVFV